MTRPSKPDTPPSYPQFTGGEPCAEVGFELYYEEKAHPTERELMAAMCERCPLYRECAEWSIARERWGYWAGMTQTERERIRTERGIAVDEPQHTIMPFWELRDDESAA